MLRNARRERRPWYIDPTPRYYGWDGDLRYPGRPGFGGGGRYNGGSFGPCWTQTPIGPVVELRLIGLGAALSGRVERADGSVISLWEHAAKFVGSRIRV